MLSKAIVIYLVGVVLIILALVAFGSPKAKMSSYNSNDVNRPIALVDTREQDFGKMTNKDIRTATFLVKNSGQSDLELSDVSTSCDCTYAYITTNGQRSSKFTMHGMNKDWIAKVSPGQEAQVEVIYEPAIMPVHGKVERTVTVATNDPANPVETFKVTAEVE